MSTARSAASTMAPAAMPGSLAMPASRARSRITSCLSPVSSAMCRAPFTARSDSGSLAARLAALVLPDEREQFRHRFQISGRLGEERTQERRGLAGRAGAVREERCRPTARLDALAHGLRRGGELLEGLRRVGMLAG